MFQHLVPPPTVNHSVLRETIAALGIDQDGQITLAEKGYLYKDIFMGKLSFNRGHKNLFTEEVEGEEQWKIGDLCYIDDWCTTTKGMVTKFSVVFEGLRGTLCLAHHK